MINYRLYIFLVFAATQIHAFPHLEEQHVVGHHRHRSHRYTSCDCLARLHGAKNRYRLANIGVGTIF